MIVDLLENSNEVAASNNNIFINNNNVEVYKDGNAIVVKVNGTTSLTTEEFPIAPTIVSTTVTKMSSSLACVVSWINLNGTIEGETVNEHALIITLLFDSGSTTFVCTLDSATEYILSQLPSNEFIYAYMLLNGNVVFSCENFSIIGSVSTVESAFTAIESLDGTYLYTSADKNIKIENGHIITSDGNMLKWNGNNIKSIYVDVDNVKIRGGAFGVALRRGVIYEIDYSNKLDGDWFPSYSRTGVSSSNFTYDFGFYKLGTAFIPVIDDGVKVISGEGSQTIDIGDGNMCYKQFCKLYINGIRTPFRKYNPDTGVWERLDNFFGEE